MRANANLRTKALSPGTSNDLALAIEADKFFGRENRRVTSVLTFIELGAKSAASPCWQWAAKLSTKPNAFPKSQLVRVYVKTHMKLR